jgi:4-amino-4-deoxy-L-arabinose transferase-like glycosyltransferase
MLAAFAMAVRIVYVLAFMRGYTPNSDADSYYAIARALARGHGFVHTLPFGLSHATAIRPPLYPFVVSVAFRIFGAHVVVAQFVSMVAGTGAVVVGALLATRIAGPRAGLAAGVVLALYPPILANDTTVLVESLAVLLALTCVVLLLDGRTVLAACVLGLLMLDRASAQWLVLVLGAWVLSRFGRRHALRFVLVTLAIVAPWVVRNAVDVGGPVLIATNGYNLNALYSSQASHDNQFVDAYFDRRFSFTLADATDEVDLDNTLWRHALHDLRSNPVRVAHVLGVSTLHWFELQPGRNHEPELLDGRNLSVRGWTLPLFYLVTAAGIAGLVMTRRRAGSQLLLLLAGYMTFVCLASIAVPRLRSVFDACTAIGAGIAIARLTKGDNESFSGAPPRRDVRMVASALALTTVFAATAVGGVQWRAHMRARARQMIVAAIARDSTAFDSLRPATVAARSEPPRYEAAAVSRLRDLAQVLLGCTPDAPPALHAEVASAARSVRLASREVDVIGLLSADQYLHPKTVPSIVVVRDNYLHRVRPADPALPPWPRVISGSTIDDANASVVALVRALAEQR